MLPPCGVLSISLSLIQQNWLAVKAQLAESVACSAVVKANAYGLGVEPVAAALYGAGCRTFFVATLAEGLVLRSQLADVDIYVLNGARQGAEATFIAQRLIPVLSTLAAIAHWVSACERAAVFAPSAIKFDTGMTRLGLSLTDLDGLCAQDNIFRRANPCLVMSHLACAEEPGHPLNRQQLQHFLTVKEKLSVLNPHLKFSLANSSGIYLGEEWHFDMVRPGAALYGVNPQPASASPVKSVVDLALPVVQVRPLSEKASIGYSATQSVAAGGCVAVVLGGYADGLHNTIGRAGVVLWRDKLLPVVGRISMDTMVIDISGLPVSECPEEGDYVQALGGVLTVDEQTKRAGALGYEVLTSLGARYERRYLRE